MTLKQNSVINEVFLEGDLEGLHTHTRDSFSSHHVLVAACRLDV